jgi:hypothetical protein
MACAELAVNLHGRFSIPAKSGIGCEIAFENGSGIDVVALRAAESNQSRIEICKAFFYQIVVVIVPSIFGDAIIFWMMFGKWIVSGVIIHRQANHRFAALKDFPRIATTVGISLQPLHVTMGTIFYPRLEIIRMSRTLGLSNSAIVKAKLRGQRFDL